MAEAPAGEGSWSSAKFRKMLLIESIASVFAKNPAIPGGPSNSGIRHESSSIAHTTGTDLEKSDVISQMNAATSALDGANSKRASDTTSETILRGGGVASIAEDPLTSHTEGGINYRSLHWWQAGMLMIAETISLGILALPAALSTVGLIPGLILLLFLGALASYTGYVIGQFKLLHPYVHSMGDAGNLLFGHIGGEILGAGQELFVVFIMASHILTFAIMMNAITDHAICNVIFMVMGMLVSLFCTLPRTLKGLTWLCVASFISIISAVGTTMIGVSITKPGLVMGSDLEVALWPRPGTDFHTAFLAVANIVFAYAGHVAFFSFISEFRRPTDFPKALALLQCSDITMYLISSIVIYYYAGEHVKSPALDSASPIVRKIAYGLAFPTIVIAGVVNGHVAVKYLFVRLLRPGGWKGKKTNKEATAALSHAAEEDLLHSKGIKAWAIWITIVAGLWVLAWLIAEGIPVFNDLLGLTSALFASWFTYGLSGMFWMHMNLEGKGWRVSWKVRDGQRQRRRWASWALLAANVLNILVGAVICIAGLYSTARSIQMHTVLRKPFSCGPI